MKVLVPLLVLLGVAACGRMPDAPAPAAPKPAAKADPAPTAEDSVSAVLQSSARTAIALRFAIEGKPQVGRDTPLRLDFSGEPGVLTLRIQGEGLALDPGSATLVLPEDGTVASQSVVLRPRTTGFTEIMVRIQPAGEGAAEVVYAIPLLVEGAAAK
jgi:hypothetical protein